MEEDPSSTKEKKRRTLLAVRWLILFIALATAVGWFLMPPSAEPRTLFLHPDGQLSLGRRDGQKFPPSAIASWPPADGHHMSDHFILDAPPETPAAQWVETLEQLASQGYASYQLRSAGEAMNFHVALMGPIIYSTRAEPQWVDLRSTGGERPKWPEMFDVVIMGDDSTTCGEILAAARPHRIPGTSLYVTSASGSLGYRRTQTEDRDHEPLKRSLAARVRGLFLR